MKEIEHLAINSITPYPGNARLHSEANVAKLVASIKEFGWTVPILVDEANTVLAGHGRLLAARALLISEVPCLRLTGLSSAQKRAYRLADNRLTLDSDWDWDALKFELGDLDAELMSIAGFDPRELDDILGRNGPQEGEDDVPELEDEAVSKLGEIWALGPHRLICADATDAKEIARLLGGVTPSVMVTDPPYGVEYNAAWRDGHDLNIGKGFDGRQGRAIGKVINDDRADWREVWTLFQGNIAYVWHGGTHAAIVSESLISSGFNIRAQIIWVKQHFVFSRGDYHWQHEPCWYAVRGTGSWLGDRKQTTVWEINNNNPFGNPQMEEKFGLSAQKPVECMRRPIVNHTSAGQAVYDPFMGSGTTLIAAETTGRIAYGCEINPLYVDIAIRRWQTFTGKEATCDGRTFAECEKLAR